MVSGGNQAWVVDSQADWKEYADKKEAMSEFENRISARPTWIKPSTLFLKSYPKGSLPNRFVLISLLYGTNWEQVATRAD